MLDKRQIWVFFLFEFKMGHKTIETTWNINTEFGSGTANEHPVQWFFKKFCKGDKSLEDKEHSGPASKVDNGQLRALIFLWLQKLLKIPRRPFYGHLVFQANWKGEKVW